MTIRFQCWMALCALARAAVAAGQSPVVADAHAVLQRAMAAQGGASALHGIDRITTAGLGHRYLREQSERPEGPWFVNYEQFVETRDYGRSIRLHRSVARGYATPNWWSDTAWAATPMQILADSLAFTQTPRGVAAGTADAAQESALLMALSPERLLVTAERAQDLTLLRDCVVHGSPHHVLSFSWRGFPVQEFVNARTSLPSAVRITRTRPASFFWYPWGDVATTFWFSGWTLERGGLRYPRLLTVESDGGPDYVWHVDRLEINGDLPPLPPLTDSLRNAARAARRSLDELPIAQAARTAQSLAPGVVQLANNWNVAEVELDDGVLILEAPMSNGYSSQVMADVSTRFPGKKIKGVVTTSDSWPHIGGLREYAARGVPIYVLDLNEPIVRRLLTHRHSLHPDSLARAARTPLLHVVRAPLTLGSGDRAVRLIPYRTATAERQMMVYFPARHLLYTSDLFSRRASGEFFLPEYLAEAMGAVRREGLGVDIVFGMHLAPTPWADVIEAIDRAISSR